MRVVYTSASSYLKRALDNISCQDILHQLWMSSQQEMSWIIYSPNRTQSCFNLTYHRLFLLCARNLHQMYTKWTRLYINAEMMFLKSMKNIISAVVPISLNLIQTNYYSEKREFHLNNMLLQGNNFIYTWLLRKVCFDFFNPMFRYWTYGSRNNCTLTFMHTHTKEVDLISRMTEQEFCAEVTQTGYGTCMAISRSCRRTK